MGGLGNPSATPITFYTSRMPAAAPAPEAPLTLNISAEIQSIFEKNKLDDLKAFIDKRKCLNQWNMGLIYLFHIIQSAGILTTTIAAGYGMKELIWVGVGFNILATLVNVFEKTNNSISKNLLKDIESIKAGTFTDEGNFVELPASKEEAAAADKK
jgi:hypothetical protein